MFLFIFVFNNREGRVKHNEFQFLFMIYFNQKTPLHHACRENNSEIALELLKRHDIDVNKSDEWVNTKSNWIKTSNLLVFYVLFFFQ